MPTSMLAAPRRWRVVAVAAVCALYAGFLSTTDAAYNVTTSNPQSTWETATSATPDPVVVAAMFPFNTDPRNDSPPWSFTADASYSTTAGVGGSGAVQVVGSGAATYNAIARLRTTWEDLGVPLGATVSAVEGSIASQVSAYNSVSSATTGGVVLKDGGDRHDLTTTIGTLIPNRAVSATDAAFVTSTGTALSITGQQGDSGAPIWIEVNVGYAQGSSKPSKYTATVDDLDLKVTYTASGTTYTRQTLTITANSFDTDPRPAWEFYTLTPNGSPPTSDVTSIDTNKMFAGAGSVRSDLVNPSTGTNHNYAYARLMNVTWESLGVPAGSIVDKIDGTVKYFVEKNAGNIYTARTRIKNFDDTDGIAEPIGLVSYTGGAVDTAWKDAPHAQVSVGAGGRRSADAITIQLVLNGIVHSPGNNITNVDELTLYLEVLVPS